MTLSLVFTKKHHLVEFPPIMKKLQSNASKRTFSLCCDFRIEHVIWVLIIHRLFIYRLKKHNYLPDIIGSCIKAFLYNLYTPKATHNVPEMYVFSKLSFLSITSMQIRNKLLKSYAKKLGIFIL